MFTLLYCHGHGLQISTSPSALELEAACDSLDDYKAGRKAGLSETLLTQGLFCLVFLYTTRNRLSVN
jgi:hypothetical protein